MAAFGENGNGEGLVLGPFLGTGFPQGQSFVVGLIEEYLIRLVSRDLGWKRLRGRIFL
jgi:hypothetical protein